MFQDNNSKHMKHSLTFKESQLYYPAHFWRRNLIQTQCVTKEKLDEIRAGLAHTPQKELRCLAQETSISKSLVATAVKLLVLYLYMATVVHALQPCDFPIRINLCN
jgi:hypothetical protein